DTQQWFGFGLYIKRTGQLEYDKLESFNGTPATMGKVVATTGLVTDPTVCSIPFTANSGTDVITTGLFGLSDNTPITVFNSGGALPAPLVAGTTYYTRDSVPSSKTFKLAATPGGSAINLTTNGSGTNKLYAGVITVD